MILKSARGLGHRAVFTARYFLHFGAGMLWTRRYRDWPGRARYDGCDAGLALSPTYHRTFDNALIFLDENFVMRINPAKELQLATLRLDGGCPTLRATLGRESTCHP